MSFKNFAIVAAAMCALSCTDFDNDFKDSNAYKNYLFGETLNEYTTNFEARYGKMDPNHTWGFGNIVGNNLATRTQVSEKNMWDQQYHLTVPGWPDSYYKSDGSYVEGLYHNADGTTNRYESTEGNVPAGDVTDEEVQYVAWWFRTHRNPNSLEIHWSDFYIQEVCSDIDRDASGNKVNYGTEYEKKNGAWEQSKYTLNQWGIDQLLVKTMPDKPGVMTLGLTDDVPANYDEEGYDHIYNFNSGYSDNLESIETVPMTSPWGENNSNLDAGNNYKSAGDFAGKTDKRLIAFYQNSGTEDFKAHYSNDEKWRSNFQDRNIWVIVHLHFTGASGRVYDGYYLGFDYAFYKEAEFDENNVCKKYQVIYPDGYYSNWIVKISPASPIVTTTEASGFSRRIMCEDLGNTYDLDFDDIVFDVTYNITQSQLNEYLANPSSIPETGIDVTVNLQAAGGTMPISVGKEIGANGGSYEAHRLFGLGNDYKTPVNVAKGANAPVANYHITVNSLDPDDIPIYVYNTKIGKLITLNKSNNGVSGNYSTSEKTNNAPQKFAVPTSVLWLKEEKQIENGYQYFANWVKNASFKMNDKDWFEDANITSDGKALLCGTRGSDSYSVSSSSSSSASSDCVVPVNTTPAKLEYRLDTKTNNAEWGTVTAPQYVEAGHSATVTATPKEGCAFVKWSDGNTDNPRQVSVNTLTTLMAYFKASSSANGYTVTISGENATPEITSTQSLGENYYAENGIYNDAQINLNCTVDENNYIFVGWYVNGEFHAGEKNCNVKISANQGYQQNLTIIAKAAPKYQMPVYVKVYDTDGELITGNDNGCGIIINYQMYPNSDNGTFGCYVGQTLPYQIITGNNFEFEGWSLSDSKPADNGSITITKDMQLTVTFKKKATEPEEPQQPEGTSKKRVQRRK